MNAAHLHLLLNHVPVLGAVFGLLLLGYALIRRSDDVTRAALWTLGLVGVTAVVVYLTGEPAEELIEGLPGFSEAALERHERAALWATVAAGAVGVLSFATLFLYRAGTLPRRFKVVMLVVAFGLSGIMGWAANLGGEVRHEEIRGGPRDPTPGAPESAEERPQPGEDAHGDASENAQDRRRAIVMPERGRSRVLREMRQMLEALNGILRHGAALDRRAMQRAALSGGTRIAVDTDAALAKRLPEAFVRLGSSTHRDFDALAGAIEAGIGRDTLLARLADLTSKCVACHASYRIATPGEDGRD